MSEGAPASNKAVCGACRDEILPEGTPFYELIHAEIIIGKSRSHVVCVECFGKIHAARGCSPVIQCPQCNLNVNGHYCWKKSVITTRAGAKISESIERGAATFISQPALDSDPGRYFSQMSSSYKSQHAVVSMLWMDDKTNETRSLVIPVPTDIPCDGYDETTKKKLESFMTVLYHVFYCPEGIEYSYRLESRP